MTPRRLIVLSGLFAFAAVGWCGPNDSPRRPNPPGAAAPAQKAPAERPVHLEVRVPDGTWTLEMQEIWRVQGELWVFARVYRPDDAHGVMMICSAVDDITATLPDLPMRYFVVGKTWEWKNTEPVEWIKRNSEWYDKRRAGQRLWRRPREE